MTLQRQKKILMKSLAVLLIFTSIIFFIMPALTVEARAMGQVSAFSTKWNSANEIVVVNTSQLDATAVESLNRALKWSTAALAIVSAIGVVTVGAASAPLSVPMTIIFGVVSTVGSDLIGDWAESKRCGSMTYGTIDWKRGSYTGDLDNCIPHGRGTWILADGDRYEGEYSKGDRHGNGSMYYSNGVSYLGEWKMDKREGQGTLTYASGSTYTGSWHNGLQHGYGVLKYYYGASYEGNWQNGKEHGSGTLTWSNGLRWVGQWENGVGSGRGTYYSPTGITWVGTLN